MSDGSFLGGTHYDDDIELSDDDIDDDSEFSYIIYAIFRIL